MDHSTLLTYAHGLLKKGVRVTDQHTATLQLTIAFRSNDTEFMDCSLIRTVDVYTCLQKKSCTPSTYLPFRFPSNQQPWSVRLLDTRLPDSQ